VGCGPEWDLMPVVRGAGDSTSPICKKKIKI